MEDFNLLIDGKRSFVMLIKNKEETYEQMIEMRRKKKDYTKGNLLDYEYFSNHFKVP